MKFYKTIIYIFTFTFFINLNAFALNSPEFYIYNFSNISIGVRVYPISFIFNGKQNYDLLAKYREIPVTKSFINSSPGEFILNANENLQFNHDYNSSNNGNNGSIGFGVYKIEFAGLNFFDSCTVEWDYGWAIAPYPFGADLSLIFRNDNNNPRISFEWAGGTETLINDTSFNRVIQDWKQPGNDDRPKNFGNFTYINQDSTATFPPDRDYNYYKIFPLDSRIDCIRILYNPNGSQYTASNLQNFGDNRIGNLTQNLIVNKSITTRDNLTQLDYPINISVMSNAELTFNTNTIFNMIEPLYPNYHTNLIIEDSAQIILKENSKIIIENENRIILRNNSKLQLFNNSEIFIKNGGIFCNEGAQILGKGNIVFDKGIFQFCSYFNDFVVEDSTKIVLEDSAVVVLPDDYTLHLKGNTTSLIMNPGSKIMFGENSGIVCDSGAKVIANDAAFTSTDSTKKWNGIFLRHRSQDTIKNCLISNAQYGINIFRKNDDEETEIPYSTEVLAAPL
ncbi:MAG: hypothetical protein WAT71_13445 [Ignavibacteria bacterium]